MLADLHPHTHIIHFEDLQKEGQYKSDVHIEDQELPRKNKVRTYFYNINQDKIKKY